MPRVTTAQEAGLGEGRLAPLRTPNLPAQASAAQFGAVNAGMLEQAGREGVGLSTDLVRIEADVARRDAAIRARHDGMAKRLEWIKTLEERKTSAAPGGDGFTAGVMKEYADWRAKTLEQAAANPTYRRHLEEDLMSLEGSIFEDATSFEAKARREHAAVQIDGLLTTAQETVLLRPESLGPALDSVRALVDASALSPAEKQKTLQAATGALAAVHWQARGLRDPRGTLAALQGGAEGQGLEAGDRLKIVNSLEVDVRRQDAEARMEARERQREARLAAAEAKAATREAAALAQVDIGERLQNEIALRSDGKPVGQPVNEEEVMQAYGPLRGPRIWAQIEDKRKVAEALGSVAGVSIEEQNQIIAETQPDPARPDYAGQVASHEAVRRAVAADQQQRLSDPASYVMRTSKAVAGAFQAATATPSQGTDPDRLRRAVALSLVEQERLGVPEERRAPLPEPQMQALAADIAREPDPIVKAERLAGLVAITDDAAVRRRMLAGLEKAGLPKGSALAVAALERGDRAGAVQILTATSGEVKVADSAARDAIRAELRREAQQGVGGAAELVSRWTGNAGYMARLQDDLAVGEQVASARVASGVSERDAAREAMSAVYGQQAVIADESLAAVVLPRGADADRAAEGFAKLRDQLPALSSWEQVQAMIDPEGKAGVISERGAQQLLDDWRDEARWINDGDGFALIVPLPRADGGSLRWKLPGPDGKPRRWTIEEVMAAADAENPAGNPLPPGMILK